MFALHKAVWTGWALTGSGRKDDLTGNKDIKGPQRPVNLQAGLGGSTAGLGRGPCSQTYLKTEPFSRESSGDQDSGNTLWI